jgi:hypothetical protein
LIRSERVNVSFRPKLSPVKSRDGALGFSARTAAFVVEGWTFVKGARSS